MQNWLRLDRLARDERGTMMIETAIVAPLLILMSLGSFQVSQVVARQSELQAAMAEASAITLSAPPETAADRDILKNIIVASTGLDASKVVLSEKFRCGTNSAYVASAGECATETVSTFILIELDDTYTPAWTNWGFGEPLIFNVDRYVMVKQS
jgi:Flp pilus assembly protein TadG